MAGITLLLVELQLSICHSHTALFVLSRKIRKEPYGTTHESKNKKRLCRHQNLCPTVRFLVDAPQSSRWRDREFAPSEAKFVPSECLSGEVHRRNTIPTIMTHTLPSLPTLIPILGTYQKYQSTNNIRFA